MVNGRPSSQHRSPEKEDYSGRQDLRVPDQKCGEKEDLDYLRQTMKGEDMAAEFLELAQKVDCVNEEQDQFV